MKREYRAELRVAKKILKESDAGYLAVARILAGLKVNLTPAEFSEACDFLNIGYRTSRYFCALAETTAKYGISDALLLKVGWTKIVRMMEGGVFRLPKREVLAWLNKALSLSCSALREALNNKKGEVGLIHLWVAMETKVAFDALLLSNGAERRGARIVGKEVAITKLLKSIAKGD